MPGGQLRGNESRQVARPIGRPGQGMTICSPQGCDHRRQEDRKTRSDPSYCHGSGPDLEWASQPVTRPHAADLLPSGTSGHRVDESLSPGSSSSTSSSSQDPSSTLVNGSGEDIHGGVALRPLVGGSPPLQSEVTPCPRNYWPDSGQLGFLEITVYSEDCVAASEAM